MNERQKDCLVGLGLGALLGISSTKLYQGLKTMRVDRKAYLEYSENTRKIAVFTLADLEIQVEQLKDDLAEMDPKTESFSIVNAQKTKIAARAVKVRELIKALNNAINTPWYKPIPLVDVELVDCLLED